MGVFVTVAVGDGVVIDLTEFVRGMMRLCMCCVVVSSFPRYSQRFGWVSIAMLHKNRRGHRGQAVIWHDVRGGVVNSTQLADHLVL